MVKIPIEKYSGSTKKGTITITFSTDKESDVLLISEIKKLIKSQPNCSMCTHYERLGSLGDYMCSNCEIHGNLEWFANPHNDMDATKCDDFEKKEKCHDE